MKTRINFSAKTIRLAKLRAAFICSRPTCRRLTVSPSLHDEQLVHYTGKVAHISAASAGGPRYDPNFSETERKAIENAIFLCSHCAELIDKNNGKDFPVAILSSWKVEHASWVSAQLNKSEHEILSHQAISLNQSGGITASTVNIRKLAPVTDANKVHDIILFKKAEKALSGMNVYKLHRNLHSEGMCKLNAPRRLNDAAKFFAQSGHVFLIPEIEHTKLVYTATIETLEEFISQYFFTWPRDQKNDNMTIQLLPEMLRSNQQSKEGLDKYSKWRALFAELIIKVDAFNESYYRYRMSVKQHLYV